MTTSPTENKKTQEDKDWIKRTKDDPCDPVTPMSNPGDRNYEC